MDLSSSRFPSNWRSILSWIIIIWLSVLLLYFSLKNIQWTIFYETIRTAKHELLFLSFFFATISNFIRSQRWRVLLSAESSMSRLDVFWATMIGYLGNSFLPARAGELIRSAVLGKRSNLGTSFVLATALTERIADVFTLLIISAISLIVLRGNQETLILIIFATTMLVVLGFISYLSLSRFNNLLRILFIQIKMPDSIKASLNDFFKRFIHGFNTLQNPSLGASFALYTICIWLIEGVLAIFNAHILDINLNLPQAMLLLAGLGFSSILPSTPGYLGIYQFVAVKLLPQFGITESQSLAFIVILQIMNYIVVTFWGLIGCWRMHYKLTIRKNYEFKNSS